jgi:PAS domain S-box-containing protein
MKRDGDSSLERAYSASAHNAPPAPAVVKLQQIPHTAERLIRGEPVILRGLEDLPVDASMDRSFFQQVSVKSLVLTPSNGDMIGKGVLGIASLSEESEWTSDSIIQLSILANLLAHTAERKKAREALRENEQLFQSLFKAASIGIALEDLEGRPLFVNPALCSLLGFTEEELCGKHCVQFSPPEDSRKDWALFEQLRTGSIDNYHLEKRYFRKDGSLIWGRLSISLLNDRASSSPLVVAMVEDITEKKVAEENLQRSESNLQNLAARLIQVQEEERHRISRELHDDIGQRLALLTIDLEDLKGSLAKAGQDSNCQLVSGLQRRTDELATDVHNLSGDLHSSKLQFLGLPSAIRELCTRISAQQNIRIDLRIEELPKDFSPDMALCFFRVAQEALNNMVKHSHAQDAFVELTQTRGAIVLKVRDFGVGFDARAPHAGIGFSSMRERLRMFGGELVVESIPGNGTELVAKLKPEKAEANAASAG